MRKQSENTVVSKLPVRVNFKPSFSYNSSTDLFIDYYAIENNISGIPTVSLAEDLDVEITLTVEDDELTTTENFILTIISNY